MIILPDRHIPRAKFLLPMEDRYWRLPSQAQQKNEFGHENHTKFCIRARLDDGHIVWQGYFDNREDFDQFLWSMATHEIQYDTYVQRLPTPWFDPNFIYREELSYEFVTLRFLTSTSSSNQTDTVPTDWNINSNFIDTIASGGSGGASSATSTNSASGGSAGAWSRKNNVVLNLGGSVTFFLNTGGAAVAATSANTAGNPGFDCWYNGTTLAGSSVGAKGGLGGNAGAGTSAAVSGGASGSGVGDSRNSGGGSGAATPTATKSASGGGGAAGPNGNGTTSTGSGDNASTGGGSGDAGSGGGGGASGGGTGSPGAEYDASHGSGGGGGGNETSVGAITAGGGGLYGSGGGGAACQTGSTATSGQGRAALITQSYTSFTPLFSLISEIQPPKRIYIGY